MPELEAIFALAEKRLQYPGVSRADTTITPDIRYSGTDREPLALDISRVGMLASSGHGPAALGMLVSGICPIHCMVLNYAFLMDLDGSREVARAVAEYGFANPCAGIDLDDLPEHVPLLLVRAGRDHFEGLNDGIDAFAAGALARNLPVTIVNYPFGVHGFDLEEKSAASRAVIRQCLDFFAGRLLVAG